MRNNVIVFQEVRAIEKELKKKKLPGKQREALEERLEKLEEEHEIALNEYDIQQGLKKESAAPKPVKEEKAAPTEEDVTGDIEERNWSSLSKKELEEECSKRGLSKKGGKEDLVSRLNLYTLSLKCKAKAAGVEATSVKPKSTAVFTAMEIPAATRGGPGSKENYRERERRKNMHKRRGAPPGERKQTDNSDAEEGAEEEEEEATPVDEEKERQQKREKLVGQVLRQMLLKSKEPIALDDIATTLEKKVKNVTPQLMGYESWEEWAENQAIALIGFNKKAKEICLPENLPSESEEEDEDSESESDSESGSSDEE